MKLYLAGPMTGIQDFNYPAFAATAAKLRDAGFDIVSPTDNGLPKNAPWPQHMRADIPMLIGCEGVALMEGWEASKGAQLERHIAMSTGIWVMSVGAWLGVARSLRASIEAQHLQRALDLAGNLKAKP